LEKERWVPLAEVARPHGVKGEIRLKLFNTDSDVLLEQREVLLRSGDGKEEMRGIDAARRANDAILVRFKGIADRDVADGLRGSLVCVRRGDFPDLEDGEFYACDAIGANVTVQSGPHQGKLGTVRDVKTYPTVDVAVIRASDGGHDWEVPLVESYVVKLDLDAGELLLSSLDDLER
jgi:16S rRNA processing protein RimM